MHSTALVTALAALFFALSPSAARAGLVAPDDGIFAETDFASPAPAVRFRAPTTSQREFYLGVSDVGVGANRVDADLAYAPQSAFSVTYDFVAGTISGTYGTTSLSRAAAGLGPANAIRVQVTGPRVLDRGDFYDWLTLTDLSVNGTPLTPSDIVAQTAPPRVGFVDFYIHGFDTTGDAITLSGMLNYQSVGTTSNLNRSAEGLKVDIEFGVAVVPLPPAAGLLLAGLAVLGLLRRRA